MRSIGFAILLIFLAGSWSGGLFAQDNWTRKHFMQWDRKDIERVMNDSPWVSRQEVRISRAKQIQSVAGSPPTNMGIGGPALVKTDQNTLGISKGSVDFVFTLRLRSGAPIRAAMLRAKQLEMNYDHLGENERAAFDAKWNGLLQCPACENNYVVTLSSLSKQEPGADAVYSVFKGARLADLQRYVYIANENGDRRALVYFVPPKVPGDEAVFFFARYDEKGASLLDPKSKELLFNLTNNEVNLVANFRIDVSHLLIDGQVSF
ncbi:MAG: hypothetical protein M3Y84_10600 [Acidobacteriota bacterium]|nr:hypothetical protein [Acidobacteriota bacterium]